MKDCKRKICVWFNEEFDGNCINTSKVCTHPQSEDEHCPAFEINNVKFNI